MSRTLIFHILKLNKNIKRGRVEFSPRQMST